jgi:hypothetical protein
MKKNISIIDTVGAQGDVCFLRVDRVPEGFREVPRKTAEPLIVAHSETGHHHVVTQQNVRMYESPNDPFTAYMEIIPGAPVGFSASALKTQIELTHLRDNHTHAPFRLDSEGGAVWQINRQVQRHNKVVAD